MPLVWVSRCRIVTCLATSGSAEPQLGQHLDDGRVQVEHAFIDKLHSHGRGPDLGDRADLEQRIGRRLDSGVLVEDAARDLNQLVIPAGPDPQDAKRGTGDPVPLRQSGQPTLPVRGVDARATRTAGRRGSTALPSQPSAG